MDILKLAVLHLGWVGTGLAILEAVSPRFRLTARGFFEAYFTGLALHVTVLYAGAAIGPVPVPAVRGLIAIGNMSGCAWVAIRMLSRDPDLNRLCAGENGPESIGESSAGQAAGRWSCLDLIIVAMLAPPVLLIFVSSWTVPLHNWDSLLIWTSKAGLLFHGEYLHSEAFTDPHWVHPHRGYPIGYSIVIFEHAAIAGRVDELTIHRGLTVFTGAGLALLTMLMSEWTGRRAALAALGLLVWTPVLVHPRFDGSISSGYADIPLGLCVALAAGLLVRGLAALDRSSLAAGAATLTLASSFKNEGMVWVALVCALTVIAAVLSRAGRRAAVWLALAAPIAAVAFIRLAHLGLPISSDVAPPTPADLVALAEIAPRLASLSVDLLLLDPSWGILRFFLPLALAAGLVRARHSPLVVVAFVVPCFLILDFAILGLTEIQSHNLAYSIERTFPRLIIQHIPVALFFSISLNGRDFGTLNPTFKSSR
jgi:hypothetical protein